MEGSKLSPRTIRHTATVMLTLALVGGMVWGLSRLGDEARHNLGPRTRYSVRFSEIDCEPPPGCDRPTFLAEVRYCSNFPESFQSLDRDLEAKLSAAFLAHPWVAAVDGVGVAQDGRVQVKLRYRTPVLLVHTDSGPRAVDECGVLLPLAAPITGLPELITPLPAPAISAGQVWMDQVIKRAVELASLHHPTKLEKTSSGWRLTMPDGKSLVVER